MRSRKLMDRQYNDQKEKETQKDKRQNTAQKTKDQATRTSLRITHP
jgi:hypothetical protein